MTNQEELESWKISKKAKEGKRYTFASEAIASFLDDDTTWLSNCRATRQWFDLRATLFFCWTGYYERKGEGQAYGN